MYIQTKNASLGAAINGDKVVSSDDVICMRDAMKPPCCCGDIIASHMSQYESSDMTGYTVVVVVVVVVWTNIKKWRKSLDTEEK